MNRRGFLGALAGLTTVGGTVATCDAAEFQWKPDAWSQRAKAAMYPDDFRHRGYRVMWSGWRPVASQNASTGFWWAGNGAQEFVSPTGSPWTLKPYQDLDVIPATAAGIVRLETPDFERDRLKREALQALLTAI